MKTLMINFVHWFFRLNKINNEIKKFSKNIRNKEILEIGCGNNPRKDFFDKSNIYICSDLNPKTKDCIKLDILEDINNYDYKYDIIICINVLDDIYNYQKAVDNMYDLLNEHGIIFLITPAFYPIHDIPNDYFRFTEYSLKKIFSKFFDVKISSIGLSRFPSCYIVEAIR